MCIRDRLHREPRLGRREDRDNAMARVLTEVLLIPEEIELVLLRRLPRDTGVHVLPLVLVLHRLLAAVRLVVVTPLAFPQVWPELAGRSRDLVDTLVARHRVEPQAVTLDRATVGARDVVIAHDRLQGVREIDARRVAIEPGLARIRRVEVTGVAVTTGSRNDVDRGAARFGFAERAGELNVHFLCLLYTSPSP